MNSRDAQILVRIKEYCDDITNAIIRFGNDYTLFCKDDVYRHSVSMCLMQIGELVSKLSDEYRNTTRRSIQWTLIKDMRNRFAHSYGEMSTDIIWETAVKDIPILNEF